MRNKGITLVALVITVIVLLVLAGVTISLVLGENGIIRKAKTAEEVSKMENAREKVIIMLGEHQIDKYREEQTSADPIHAFFSDKLSKGEIEEITENTTKEISIQVDGYEFTIDKETLKILGEPQKVGGVKPIFEVQITKMDGTTLTTGETEKALTVEITNLFEYGSNYRVEVKDEEGNVLTKEANVVGSLTGQASYKIIQSGTYSITVAGTKESSTRTVTKIETILLAMPTITTQFNKANGVIDIVWLDTDNNVISSPISPASYLTGMTAIKYNGTNWVAADTTNVEKDWYQYIAQTGVADEKTSNWANAKKNSGANEVNFVWIPRYAYKITYFDTVANENAYRADSSSKTGIVGYSTIEGMIDITSGKMKQVEGTAPKNVTGTVKTEEYKEYIPHPAFEFDGVKAGIWVGKYESSGSASTVTIIPNIASLRNITVSNIVSACQGVKMTYSLTSDSHMMKNTEWGAVAYLTDSKYGRNGVEVQINSNQNYVTSGGDFRTKTNQSTTGNIYGIYDMSGGVVEYLAGYVNNSQVTSNGYNTNLLNAVAKNKKYADIYITKGLTEDTRDNNYAENKGMKGDAIYETSTTSSETNSWNADFSSFPGSSSPVFRRGRSLLW